MRWEEPFLGPEGWKVIHLGETGSTNDLAREAGKGGAPDKTVFVADHQLRGRGRLDRSWLEEPRTSLLFSILFRRVTLPPMLLTMACSVAAAEAVEEVAGVRVEIKWPNDLMVKGRKLAGLLTEVGGQGADAFVVMGMGINVNFDPSGLPGIPCTATSLLRETGVEHSRPRLLHLILARLDALLSLAPARLSQEVRTRWADRLWRRRQKVVLAEGGANLEGVFEDVAEDGALLLRLDDGTLKSVRAGDLLV